MFDRAASAVEGVLHGAGDGVADLVETAGSLAADRLGWIGRAVAGWCNVLGAAVTGVAGIVGGVPAGVLRLLGGLVTWDRRLAVRGVVGLAAPIAGAVILLLGTIVAAVQRMVGAEAAARPLTAEELVTLRGVFGDSLSYRNVRVVQGRCGLFGTNDRAFTLGNTVYLKGIDLADRPDILVHEVVHVWQYQHDGPRYTADALGAQVVYGWKGRGAYEWRAELDRGRTSWRDFNDEAQGAYVQQLWAEGQLDAPDPAGAIAAVRSRRSVRLSTRLQS